MHKIIRTANRLPSQNFTHHLAFYVNYFKPEKSNLSVYIVQRNITENKKQGEEMENRLDESQTRESRETLKLSSMEILKPNLFHDSVKPAVLFSFIRDSSRRENVGPLFSLLS